MSRWLTVLRESLSWAVALGVVVGVEKCPTWHQKASERLAEAARGDVQLKITEAA